MSRPPSLVLSPVLLVLWAITISQMSQAAPAGIEAGTGLPYPPGQKPKPDEIVHVPTGLAMSFDEMMDMVAGARLVCIGESHDNLRAHEVQLQIIRDLDRRFPGRIAIGMEMFRQPQQDVLDRWTEGRLGELEFLEAVNWQETWSADFRLYRGILDFARERRLDVVALNPPRELQDALRRHGSEALPDDLRRQLPEVGEPDPYQTEVLEAFYGGHLPTEGALDSFLRIQLLWEESMAERVVDYLKSARGEGKIMITLTGAGHVEYGFGVPKKVLRRMPLPYVIIAPTEIEVPPEKQMADVSLPEIPLLPADFVWWIPYQELDADTVRLGVGVGDENGVVVVRDVVAGSPAGRAGILAGDEIVSLDGHPITNMTALVYRVRQQTKGTTAVVTIRRDGALRDVRVDF